MEKSSQMRQAAMNWLARRDLSTKEVTQRLARRFPGDDVNAVIEWLEQKGFLNDARFAEVFFRSRIERGHGPLRIRQEMQQKGLGAQLVEHQFETSDCDWFELAKALRVKRFGDALASASDADKKASESPPKKGRNQSWQSAKPSAYQKEKARQLRFLQYRGFTSEQCMYALKQDTIS